MRNYHSYFQGPLNAQQESVLIGTVLGDAHLGYPTLESANPRLELNHCEAQSEYLAWKVAQFKGLFTPSSPARVSDKFGIWFKKNSRCHPVFAEYYSLFYRDRVKFIADVVLDRIDDIALAVWMGDDGTKHHKQLVLCLGGLQERDYLLVQGWLKSRGYYTSRRNHPTRKAVYLKFDDWGTARIGSIMERVLPTCLHYKLHN